MTRGEPAPSHLLKGRGGAGPHPGPPTTPSPAPFLRPQAGRTLTRMTSCGTAAMARGRMMTTAPADCRRAFWYRP